VATQSVKRLSTDLKTGVHLQVEEKTTPQRLRWLSAPQYTMCSIPGLLSPEVKRLGRESRHLPPLNAEINNALSYTFTHRSVSISLYLQWHRDNSAPFRDMRKSQITIYWWGNHEQGISWNNYVYIGCCERRLIGHSFYLRNFLRKSCGTCQEKWRRSHIRLVMTWCRGAAFLMLSGADL
jgi:hypothetical protein